MFKLPASFTPARHQSQRASTRDASDFLRGNDKLAALLPAAARLASLQRECVALMPASFAHCTVLQVTDGQLQIAVPNAALATRIKQMLPKLQAGLVDKGWPIESIKLKIQVVAPPLPPAVRELSLPARAVSSFAELDKNLEGHPRNEALKEALRNLVERRTKKD